MWLDHNRITTKLQLLPPCLYFSLSSIIAPASLISFNATRTKGCQKHFFGKIRCIFDLKVRPMYALLYSLEGGRPALASRYCYYHHCIHAQWISISRNRYTCFECAIQCHTRHSNAGGHG